MKKDRTFWAQFTDWLVFIFTGGGEIAREAEAEGIVQVKSEG